MAVSNKIKVEYSKYKEFLKERGGSDKTITLNQFASSWGDYSEERRKDPTASHQSIRKQIEYDSLYGTKYKVARARRMELKEFLNDPKLKDHVSEEQYNKILDVKNEIMGKSLKFFKKQSKDDFDRFLNQNDIYSQDLYRYVLDQNNNNTKQTAAWFSRHIFGSP